MQIFMFLFSCGEYRVETKEVPKGEMLRRNMVNAIGRGVRGICHRLCQTSRISGPDR